MDNWITPNVVAIQNQNKTGKKTICWKRNDRTIQQANAGVKVKFLLARLANNHT